MLHNLKITYICYLFYSKLVDNFGHESDVTSLQDPVMSVTTQMSRPYKTPSRHVP